MPNLPLILGGIQIGSGLVSNFLAGRDEEKFKKTLAQQQARGNLVSALTRGRVNPQPTVQPKLGFLTRGLGAISQGASAAGQLLSLHQAGKDQALKRQAAQQGLALGQMQLDQERGRVAGLSAGAFSAADVPPPRSAAAPSGATLPKLPSLQLPIPKQAPEGSDAFRAGFSVAQQGLADRIRAQELQNLQSQIAQRELAQGDRRLDLVSQQQWLDYSANIQRQAAIAQKELRQEEKDAIDRRIAEEKARIQSAKDRSDYIRQQQTAIGNLPGFSQTGLPTISNSFSGASAIFNRIRPDGSLQGADAISLLNFYQRFIDPATVREGDVALMQSAQSIGDQLKARIGRWEAGEVVSKTLVDQMKNGLIDMYAARLEYLGDVLAGYEANFVDENQVFGVGSFRNISGLNAAADLLRPFAGE